MRRRHGHAIGWLILADRPLGWWRWPWWRWWRRHVHPWTDAPRSSGLATGGKSAPIVAGVTFVSERESGAWIDCVPCSGAMIAGWAEREPSPHLNDAHRIREGAGLPHSGGMTDSQLGHGLDAVYGTGGSTVAATKSAILAGLDDGRGFTWFHTYGRLPENLRRWSPAFTGGHCAALIGRKSPTSDLVGWFDPLATDGWSGEWVSIETLLAADWGDPARSYIRSEEAPAVSVDLVMTDATPAYVDIAEGKNLYNLDGSERTHVSVAQPQVYSPFVSGSRRAVRINTHGEVLCLLANNADCTNVTPYCPPVPEPPPAGGYAEGYTAGATDTWDAWADGLGIPPRPPAE